MVVRLALLLCSNSYCNKVVRIYNLLSCCVCVCVGSVRVRLMTHLALCVPGQGRDAGMQRRPVTHGYVNILV